MLSDFETKPHHTIHNIKSFVYFLNSTQYSIPKFGIKTKSKCIRSEKTRRAPGRYLLEKIGNEIKFIILNFYEW